MLFIALLLLQDWKYSVYFAYIHSNVMTIWVIFVKPFHFYNSGISIHAHLYCSFYVCIEKSLGTNVKSKSWSLDNNQWITVFIKNTSLPLKRDRYFIIFNITILSSLLVQIAVVILSKYFPIWITNVSIVLNNALVFKRCSKKLWGPWFCGIPVIVKWK